MRKIREIRKNRRGKKRMREDAKRRLRWKMQPDTYRENGNGSKT